MSKKFEFIGTYTGVVFEFNNPTVDMVDIIDISQALSNLCRYSGHVKKFYSVAEHSSILSWLVYDKTKCPKKALSALLHDASEAYLVDVPRPIKPYLKGYEEMEAKIEAVIQEKFGIDPMDEYTLYLDQNIVRDEASQLFLDIPDWVYYYESVLDEDFEISCLPPEEARKVFLADFYFFTEKIEGL